MNESDDAYESFSLSAIREPISKRFQVNVFGLSDPSLYAERIAKY
jgi:hypothetical protein